MSSSTSPRPGKTRRLPLVRVVPRIAYFQGRYDHAGTLVRRLAVVGAEHLVDVKLADGDQPHEKLGKHTFVMRPADLHAGASRQLKFQIEKYYQNLGLLPDWDYTYSFQAEVPDRDNGGTKTANHNAFLMLTVKRKRRERTIVLPIRKLTDPGHLANLTVELFRPGGSPLQGANLEVGVRVGGVPWTKTAPGSHIVTIAGVPRSRFVVQIDPDSLPDGLAAPRRGLRMVDLSGGNQTIQIRMRRLK